RRDGGDPLDVEAGERGFESRPVRGDVAPADPRLEDTSAQLLEIVVEGLRFDLRRSAIHRPVTLRLVQPAPRLGPRLPSKCRFGAFSRAVITVGGPNARIAAQLVP